MTQLDGQTKEIDGFTYKVLMLDPLIASDLLVDIGKIFGPALGSIGQSLLKSGDTKAAFGQLLDGVDGTTDEVVADLLGDSLERALVGMIDRVEKHKLREIIGIMSEVTTVQLKPGEWPSLGPIFAAHFRGRVMSMYKWLVFAVRSQYQVFS